MTALDAPAGFVHYIAGAAPGTPIYDGLVAEHGIDPVRDLDERRYVEYMRDIEHRLRVAIASSSWIDITIRRVS